jgi:hypothetical protein
MPLLPIRNPVRCDMHQAGVLLRAVSAGVARSNELLSRREVG